MTPAKSKLKKTVLILLSLLIVLPILILIFASPITKYLVEKYSITYTGRQIRMDKAYVNLFTGYVHFSNVRVYEATTDSIFFSADGLSMRFALHKMLSKTYE